MHSIQQDILKRITLQPQARYSDLKSDEIDGNLFMYHLNKLMEAGFIEKTDKEYGLSLKGKRYVAMLSTESGEQREQPQILVMIICQNNDGHYALFKWKREPNVGLVSFPHGKMHLGASICDMAQQEIAEKCGLKGECRYKGSVYLRTILQKELFVHQLIHLFVVKGFSGELLSTSKNGDAFWGNPNDIPETEVLPGTWEILDLLSKKDEITLEEIQVEV